LKHANHGKIPIPEHQDSGFSQSLHLETTPAQQTDPREKTHPRRDTLDASFPRLNPEHNASHDTRDVLESMRHAELDLANRVVAIETLRA